MNKCYNNNKIEIEIVSVHALFELIDDDYCYSVRGDNEVHAMTLFPIIDVEYIFLHTILRSIDWNAFFLFVSTASLFYLFCLRFVFMRYVYLRAFAVILHAK